MIAVVRSKAAAARACRDASVAFLALHIVEPDAASPAAERLERFCSMHKTQLATYHISVCSGEAIVADRPPSSSMVDLEAAACRRSAALQANTAFFASRSCLDFVFSVPVRGA